SSLAVTVVVGIVLGESVLASTVAVAGGLQESEHPVRLVVIGLAGFVLAAGMWWLYFATDFGALLPAHRDRSFIWGYGHLLLFPAVAGVGAGLHVAAYVLEHEAHIGTAAAVACVAVPVAGFLLIGFALTIVLTGRPDVPHLALVAAGLAVCAAAVLLAAAGLSMGAALLVVTLSPWVAVVGIELRGRRAAVQ
ncbi:MAG TPA: low temperature requirement protein A, partial [Micropruina sp.]|nr:low temperature requirement protein A [Micropruina sp.]